MMDKYIPHLGHFSIIEACRQSGCPVCSIRKNAVTTYLQAILSHYVDDPDMRERLCHVWGYCRTHAWMLSTVDRGNLLTIAVMYQDILEKEVTPVFTRKRARLKRNIFTDLIPRLFRHHHPTTSSPQVPLPDHCPACDVEHDVETTVLQIMLKALAKQDEHMQKALRDSDGLCLPHVNRALETVQDATARNLLLDLTREKLARIQEELRELIRKHDYRFQHEAVGDEKWGWKRAINAIVGAE